MNGSRIVGFHRDDQGDWIADLECGHSRHVRHNPPWEERPWVQTEECRALFLGRTLVCKHCPHVLTELADQNV